MLNTSNSSLLFMKNNQVQCLLVKKSSFELLSTIKGIANLFAKIHFGFENANKVQKSQTYIQIYI